MAILILAAGDQKRWQGYPTLKQHLPIGSTTIYDRTYQQVRRYDPITVSHKAKIWQGRQLVPGARRWTAETLLSAKDWWGKRTTVLLGDVIYSGATLDKVLSEQRSAVFFGNEWEIFAISFAKSIEDRLRETVREAERGEHLGKLRNCYDGFEPKPYFETICHLTDYTNDIDTPEEYEAFLKQHLVTMQHDDDRHLHYRVS